MKSTIIEWFWGGVAPLEQLHLRHSPLFPFYILYHTRRSHVLDNKAGDRFGAARYDISSTSDSTSAVLTMAQPNR